MRLKGIAVYIYGSFIIYGEELFKSSAVVIMTVRKHGNIHH